MNPIKIQGARVHNLKNISLTIPKNKFIVATGISGSGKSSLVFDILFEEGRRQYLQSLGILSEISDEDKYDTITGLGPTIAVKQNIIRQSNPRSTVGSKTGILNSLSILYAGEGTDEFGDHLSKSYFSYNTSEGMCMKCAGLGSYYSLDTKNIIPDEQIPLGKLFETLGITPGFIRVLKRKFDSYWTSSYKDLPEDIKTEILYGHYENNKQSYSIERLFKNRLEKEEDVEKYYRKIPCRSCHGYRISEEARGVTLLGKHIGELGLMELSELSIFVDELSKTSSISSLSQNIIKEIQSKIKHLTDFRLGHLTLYRELSTLSGGELQRLFLNSHLESRLDSLIYVFDEPTAGLHPSEKMDTLHSIRSLQKIGNTVIAIEHEPYAIRQADYIIDIGPYAGINGGQLIYEGEYKNLLKCSTSITGQFLSGARKMPVREKKDIICLQNGDKLLIKHATKNNLKDLTVSLPLHALVGIAGKSGSGKSTLISDTLLPLLRNHFHHKGYVEDTIADLSGFEQLKGLCEISQLPIGRNSNSTPASFIGIWDKIRELYAAQTSFQLNAGHFSFNSSGACRKCSGSGYERIQLGGTFTMDKICPVCQGKRYNDDTLSVLFHGKSIADILMMSVEQALEFFKDYPSICTPLSILCDIGMGYIRLGQPTSSLSGGEAQRVKLAKELGKKHTSNILYVLDEPTAGLSQYDTAKLILLLDRLVANGNSIFIIEHNTEILKICDWIIELGPEGGRNGGQLIAEGTPEMLKNNPFSPTGKYL